MLGAAFDRDIAGQHTGIAARQRGGDSVQPLGEAGAGIMIMGLSHPTLPIALGRGVLGIGTGISNPLICDKIVARTTPEVRRSAIWLS